MPDLTAAEGGGPLLNGKKEGRTWPKGIFTVFFKPSRSIWERRRSGSVLNGPRASKGRRLEEGLQREGFGSNFQKGEGEKMETFSLGFHQHSKLLKNFSEIGATQRSISRKRKKDLDRKDCSAPTVAWLQTRGFSHAFSEPQNDAGVFPHLFGRVK